MYSKVYSGTWEGIEGVLVQVEADISNGMPLFELIGYLSAEVKEAKERGVEVKSAEVKKQEEIENKPLKKEGNEISNPELAKIEKLQQYTAAS